MRRIQRRSTVAVFTLLIAVAPVWGQQFSDWSAPINLGRVVNSPFGDFFPTIAKDGLSLYFTSSRNPAHPDDPTQPKDWDIYVCQRATASDPWGPPQSLGPNINTPFDEGAPSLSIDGHRMYFASNRPGGFGGNDIYVSRRHDKRDDFGWEYPDNVGGEIDGGINTESNEAGPAIFQDDARGVLTLYFDSNRPGGRGPFTDDAAHNGNDIYASDLKSDETFGPAVLIAELSTPFLDRQPAIRRDGLEIFFASTRPQGFGGLDLWVSTRATTSDSWSAPVNMGSPVNTPANEAAPALSFDGTTLYFQSIGSPNPAFDLFVTTRSKQRGHDGKPHQYQ
jgi:hypothetical protein